MEEEFILDFSQYLENEENNGRLRYGGSQGIKLLEHAYNIQKNRLPIDMSYMTSSPSPFRVTDPIRRVEINEYSDGDESDINSVGSDGISDTDIPSIVNINDAIRDVGNRQKRPGIDIPGDALSNIMNFISLEDHRKRAREHYRVDKNRRFRRRQHRLSKYVETLDPGTDTEDEWDELDWLHKNREEEVREVRNMKKAGMTPPSVALESIAHTQRELKKKTLAYNASRIARLRNNITGNVKKGYEHTLGPPGLKRYGKWFDNDRDMDRFNNAYDDFHGDYYNDV